MKQVFFILLIFFVRLEAQAVYKKPTVLVSILVRNKEHILPYFLSNFERLNYPKDRISLWIYSDHNVDRSITILREWTVSVKDSYHSLYTNFEEDNTSYPGEEGVGHWTDARFTQVINLRESSINYGRSKWADYLLSIDADVILTNPETLNYLIARNKTAVAPLLNSEGLYSNFWHGMSEDYYYQRTDDYKPILKREITGCFVVPMIHSCVLVNLRTKESDFLTYSPERVPYYKGPLDDIIVFALSAKHYGISLHVCNEELFGYVTVPLDQNDSIDYDYDRLLNIKMDVLHWGTSMYVSEGLKKFTSMPKKHKMMFDKIYMINLKRRPDRRKRMQHCFNELGLDVETFDAVDGKTLNESFLSGLSYMPDFEDPYHKRPMKLGEIGCFLSHYRIWEKIVEQNLNPVLVLEDDIRFETFFKTRVKKLMEEVAKIPNWDLVYFGRKKLQNQDEPFVKGSSLLVDVGYSYWTLGYALSLQGAKKLIEAKPLEKLVPVDEYLPIMFDRHPQEKWKEYYTERGLVAFSAAPLLLYPTHYTGEKGYISDTEDSSVVAEILLKTDL